MWTKEPHAGLQGILAVPDLLEKKTLMKSMRKTKEKRNEKTKTRIILTFKTKKEKTTYKVIGQDKQNTVRWEINAKLMG